MPHIIVTGDTHGDFTRFSNRNWPLAKELTRDDIVVVTGDFGGVWDDSRRERYWLDWLERRPFTTLFVDGNHENFDMLATYPQEYWRGGETDVIRPHVRHLRRGYVFDLYGLKCFVMGGASSHDIQDGILDPDDPDFKQEYRALKRSHARFRVQGVDWWPQEMPSQEEYDRAVRNLDKHGWNVDLVLTHCGPTGVIQRIDPRFKPDPLTDFLEQVNRRLRFRTWYFGHYHTDHYHADLTADRAYHCQYDGMTVIDV